MAELPKVARRSPEQKAAGYVNAGQEGLKRAVYHLGNDHPAYVQLTAMIEQLEQLKEWLNA